MAEDIQDEIKNDFDDDDMEDMLDDSVESSSDETQEKEKGSSIKKVFVKLKQAFRQIMGSKKTILVIAGSFVLLIILVTGIWLFFFKAGPENASDVQNTAATGQDGKTTGQQETVVFKDIIDLEPFERIPLKAGSPMALISMKLSLELTDPGFVKQVSAMEDRIRKIITGQVEEMTWLELRNPEGKIMLKYSLLKRINSIFPKAMVRNIYFTYFIMQ